MDKIYKIYLSINIILISIVFTYITFTDYVYKSVDNVKYKTTDKSIIEKYFNKKDFYYVKLYKERFEENRLSFDTLKIEETLENNFKYINKCKFTRYTIFNDDGTYDNYKVRNQNSYQYVYTTIPKNNLKVVVSDYLLIIDIVDKDKLSSLLSVNKRLSLKPIEIRIWLNIRDKTINGKILDSANEDLAEVGLKITGYTKL